MIDDFRRILIFENVLLSEPGKFKPFEQVLFEEPPFFLIGPKYLLVTGTIVILH